MIWIRLFLLLVLLVGVGIADEVPGYVTYMQGGKGSLTEGTDGISTITVKDIVLYFHLTEGNKSRLILVERLANLTYPLNAMVVFPSVNNESISNVMISNLSLSDEIKLLTLQVTPMKYFEGKMLKSFASKNSDLDL